MNDKIADLEAKITELDIRLSTLIVWIAQSANSPLSVADAEQLLNQIGKA